MTHYTSRAALFVLAKLSERFQPGDVVMFDDLGTLWAPDHEYRALEDYLAVFGQSLSLVGTAGHHMQVVFVVA